MESRYTYLILVFTVAVVFLVVGNWDSGNSASRISELNLLTDDLAKTVRRHEELLRAKSQSTYPIPRALPKQEAATPKTKIITKTRIVKEPCTTNEADFALAYKESLGFFKDIAEHDWKLMKKHHKEVPNCLSGCNEGEANKWYQFNYEPTFSCAHEVRIGGMGDGPKWVCDPYRIDKNNCLVFSFGSNNEFGFEEAIHKDVSDKCEIHTFDHTVGSNPSRKPSYVNFHPWGIAASSYGSLKTLKDIIATLNHTGRMIDVFKIDCEGCEWDTYKDIFALTNVRQIQIELHRIDQARALFQFAQAHNFVVFHKEPNIAYSGGRGLCIEYAFLKLSKDFFE